MACVSSTPASSAAETPPPASSAPETPPPAASPLPDLPPFLDPTSIRRSCAVAGLGEVAVASLLSAAGRISARADLLDAMRAAYRRVFAPALPSPDPEPSSETTVACAAMDAALGEDVLPGHALLALDSVRLVHERHRARGLDDAMAAAVSGRHAVAWLREAERRTLEEGVPFGLADWMPIWLRIVTVGDFYRLGRLEFVLMPLVHPVRVFREVASGRVLLLAEAGRRFGADGLLVPEGAEDAGGGGGTWVSVLREEADAVHGTPIDVDGRVSRGEVRLPRDRWQQVLGPGDHVAEIHVPAEGELSVEALREAMESAVGFFERYHPDRPFAAFSCGSWLFSPELPVLLGVGPRGERAGEASRRAGPPSSPEAPSPLPARSNILRWQEEGHLFPSEAGAEWFLEFTFGARSIDPATAPRDTRLRWSVVEHLERGGALHCGSWLLLRSELPAFGGRPHPFR